MVRVLGLAQFVEPGARPLALWNWRILHTAIQVFLLHLPGWFRQKFVSDFQWKLVPSFAVKFFHCLRGNSPILVPRPCETAR